MRIQLVGSHGTGKSTLLRELKKRHPDIHQQDGTSRPIAECKKELGLTEYQNQYICNKLNFFNWDVFKSLPIKYVFITRSPLDAMAYSRVVGFDDLAKDAEKQFEKLDISDTVWIYLPIEFELEDDGVRYTDPKFQKAVDDALKFYIDKYHIPVHSVSGSVEERVKQVEDILGL